MLTAWLLLLSELQYSIHRSGELFPIPGFSLQLLLAGLRDRVITRPPIVFGGAPLCGDPPALHKADKSGVDGAFVQLQRFGAELLEPARNPVSVERTESVEAFQDHEIE